MSFVVFQRLRELLLQISTELGKSSTFLTEAALRIEQTEAIAPMKPFCLLISEPFKALVTTEVMPAVSVQPVSASLTFEPEAIAQFLDQLAQTFPATFRHRISLKRLHQQLQPNDPTFQGEFTLRLIQLLSSSESPTAEALQSDVDNSDPDHQACLRTPLAEQPAAIALQKQIEQEQVTNQIIAQIWQSLDLPIILQTAVDQLQNFFPVDRVVIYQLTPQQMQGFTPANAAAVPKTKPQRTGFFTYEARKSQDVPSILHLAESCTILEGQSLATYQQGFAIAVESVESYYADRPALIQFLQQAQVKSELMIPILVQGQLWGLLVAQDCRNTHQWQDNDCKFLKQIADHLAIAITQAQLYAEVQRQKETLEQRVIERTQQLQDTMLTVQMSNRAKGEFLAAVSHELRTPLTCIIGMSATLLRWSANSLSDRQRGFLDAIHNSGETLLEIINNILDLSQLEAGKSILNLEEFSLTTLAQQSLRVVQERAAQKEVELELDSTVDMRSDRFMADPRRVRQILLNLLSNAIKFTPSGGKVTLRLAIRDNVAILSIKDTGIGIPDQQRSLLFQKFQQLDSSYHREYGGLGLGLALTKQLVEIHGGWVQVESTVGVGSVFTVWLPNQKQTPQTTSKIESNSDIEPTSGRIVLLASHEESAEIVCDVLNAVGYQLIWMTEGYNAVTQIEILLPELVIIDVDLSDSDGYELIQELRQNPTTKDCKILAITPAERSSDLERCLTAGANQAIYRPIIPESILNQVNTLLTEIKSR